MRLIKKGKEPNSLTIYKKQNNAYYDGCNKSDIRKALLIEQGHLCAYCMKRISEANMTIEHYEPQSNISEKDALDYSKMLGVCLGNRSSKKEHQTCDAHRGNQYLTVNPFDKTSIGLIKYDNNGKIYSDNPDINIDLEVTLNLNCKQVLLMKNRKKALLSLKIYLSQLKPNGKWSKEFLQKILAHYEASDENGRFEPYSGILLYYLSKKLQTVNINNIK